MVMNYAMNRWTDKCTLLLASLLVLGGCATGGDYSASSPERQAERLADDGQHDDAAAQYIGMATDATGAERDRLTLLAVEQWLDAGDGRRARTALQSVTAPGGGELLWLWSANAAALALWEGRPDDAASLLEPLSRQPLPQRQRLRVEALKADTWFQLGQPSRAVDLYMQRENWIDDDRGLERNKQRLWAGLTVSDVSDLRAAAGVSQNDTAAGWLSLGVLAVSTGQQGVGWSNGVIRWQESHGNHPANSIIDDLALPDGGGLLEYPGQLALLLPLTGNNAAAGKAVQNGFLGAYFSANIGNTEQQIIKIYDSTGPGGTTAAYARAVEDGAEFVVGPLLRSNVSSVARQGLLPVPLLTLNYLPDNIEAPAGMYQFALAPEDEARSAAARARMDGAKRAIALYPNNDWGRRVATSFANEFEASGGMLLAHRSYQTASQDFSVEIEGLMGLSESVQRYQRMRANIGGSLQFDPRRRQDVDAIFLAADSKAGRLIKSQLKFHYSGDLPVYSTSFIYSMDGRSDSDLNGVMFAETPWVIAPPARMSRLPGVFSEHWPAERRLTRLHAMGYDAYQLVTELFAARGGIMPSVNGASGTLFLDVDGRIHRNLAWAQFERGEPVALPDNAAPEEEVVPLENTNPGEPVSWQSLQPSQ